ncbi:metal ABC transporter substrate-binding protein [Moritella sp. F3]|uniref:metal ABC transporter substrate-binding protein n=1 Tax=Moritella sp. F3 TaxID=2718882 RepID=UPI001A1B5998|nr:metal ABC transporter substrate-binding protein [Moritella sp. F3]GIC75705.1 metal ABC transporter substrate-binding protein [Moritella sp. F1]GIC81847.1 metal ABC transporter substrate-binding protein [Moritella sp. F3]
MPHQFRFMLSPASIFSILSLFTILLSAVWTTNAVAAENKFKVVTTFTVIADMARNIAGDAAVVTSITKPDAEIHNYQATPGDIRRAQGADLIIYNGLNLELWFDKFFHNLRDVPSVVVTKGIVPMGISQGPYSGKPNPHAWMSADNALIYIENIRQAFVMFDGANAAVYNQNAQHYSAQILDAVAPFKQQLAALPKNQRWLVTSEGAFSYLARDYDLKELFLWPINADSQGTPQQVRKVIDKMKANQIAAIFSESTVSARPAQQVARETGSRYAGVLYVDSLSAIDGPVPTYIDLLKVTLGTIAKGLEQE